MLSRIITFYKRHSGSWAWILHRLTGIALVVYVILHLWELHTLSYVSERPFNHKMVIFQALFFKFIEWALLGVVFLHALNGIRVMIVDFYGGARYHKKLMVGLGVLYVLLMGFAGWPMFFRYL